VIFDRAPFQALLETLKPVPFRGSGMEESREEKRDEKKNRKNFRPLKIKFLHHRIL
jgi:hypothetical protein